MDGSATLPTSKNKSIDRKYIKYIEALQKDESEYMDNTVFKIYLLNVLSKRIMEWRSTLETWRETKHSESNNNGNKEYYKSRVKELLFKNELLRESISRTKSNDFLYRTLPQNDIMYNREKHRDDARLQTIAICMKNKVDQINKYHEKHSMDGENVLNKIRLDINQLYEQINFYNRNEMKNELILGATDDFKYILEPLLTRCCTVSNVQKMWCSDFINYLKFGKIKGILSDEYEAKLQVLYRAQCVDKNKIKKLMKKKMDNKKWKKRFNRIFGDEYKGILMNETDFSRTKNEFYDNRKLFKQIATQNEDQMYNNRNNHNKMICNTVSINKEENYDEYVADDDCYIDSDGMSVYSYEYNGDSLSECTDIAESDAKDDCMEIDPMYRNIEWETSGFIAKNTNVPNLKSLRSRHTYKRRMRSKTVKRRNKKKETTKSNIAEETQNVRQFSVPPLVNDPNDPQEMAGGNDRNINRIKPEPSVVDQSRKCATTNIPYLGQILPQNTSSQSLIQIKKDMSTNNSIDTNINDIDYDDNNTESTTRLLSSMLQIRRDNQDHERERQMIESLTAQSLTYIPNSDQLQSTQSSYSTMLPQFDLSSNESKQNADAHNIQIPLFDADTAFEDEVEHKTIQKIEKCAQCHITESQFNTKQEFITHQTHCNRKNSTNNHLDEMNRVTLKGMTNSLKLKFNDLYWKKPYNPMLYTMQNVLNGDQTQFALKNKQFIPPKQYAMDDNRRLWRIANSTIQPITVQYIAQAESDCIGIMLGKSLPSKIFPKPTVPLSLRRNKAERCTIYKNFDRNLCPLQLNPPVDATRDDMNNAPYYQQQKNNKLTYIQWINYYMHMAKNNINIAPNVERPPPPPRSSKRTSQPPPPPRPYSKYQPF